MVFHEIYIWFLICLLIAFSHRKHFQNWSETELDEKIFASVSIMGVVIFGIFSLLFLFGLFE